MAKELSRDQLWELYERLPEDLREAIWSEETADINGHLAEQYGFSHQVSTFAELVGDALLGLLPPRELKERAQSDLGLAAKAAEALVRDVERLIFHPVRKSLDRLYSVYDPQRVVGVYERYLALINASQDGPRTKTDKDIGEDFDNFYWSIKELDIELSREENYEQLRKAASNWSKRTGRKAQEKERLIKDAMRVFGTESAYEKYHEELALYCQDKLLALIDIGLADDTLSAKEQQEIIRQGERELCLPAKEVEALLEDLLDEKGITVAKDSALGNLAQFINWLAEKASHGVEIVEQRLSEVAWFQDFTGSYKLVFGLVGLAFFTLVVGLTIGTLGGFFILLGTAVAYLFMRRRR